MRIRWEWLTATALAYGLIGGYLLYSHLWDVQGGLARTPTARGRAAWAAFVFLTSTFWLARRNPGRGGGWMALHASGAFLLGAAAAWGMVEYLMRGSEHPWDTDIPDFLASCVNCAQRAPIVRQTRIAALSGTVAAAVLAPRVVRALDRSRSRFGPARHGAEWMARLSHSFRVQPATRENGCRAR